MKHLVLFCHPSQQSFNHAVLEAYCSELKDNGHKVTVRNLYQSPLHPILTQEEYEDTLKERYEPEVAQEQELISWCDCVTMIYPIWWGGMPALLKGYVDRVFSYGFAYELDGEDPIPRMKGKSTVTICTTGTPYEVYDKLGMYKAMDQARNHAIFEFCGFTVKHSVYYGDVIQASDEERRNMLENVREIAGRLIEQ